MIFIILLVLFVAVIAWAVSAINKDKKFDAARKRYEEGKANRG